MKKMRRKNPTEAHTPKKTINRATGEATRGAGASQFKKKLSKKGQQTFT